MAGDDKKTKAAPAPKSEPPQRTRALQPQTHPRPRGSAETKPAAAGRGQGRRETCRLILELQQGRGAKAGFPGLQGQLERDFRKEEEKAITPHRPRRAEERSVIPWSLLDTAHVPGGGELRLMRRGAEFSIMLGGNELMNSRVRGTEEALATIACERIRSRATPRILIGGLGMGFTLRAALAALGADARIVVAELVPAVLAWARGPMAEVFGSSLTDPRVSAREADVADLIRSGSVGVRRDPARCRQRSRRADPKSQRRAV